MGAELGSPAAQSLLAAALEAGTDVQPALSQIDTSLIPSFIKISATPASSHASVHKCLAMTTARFGAEWGLLSEPRNAAPGTEPCTGKLGMSWAVSGAAVGNVGLELTTVIDCSCIPRGTNQGLDCQVCSLCFHS